jgi:hypothetical protein
VPRTWLKTVALGTNVYAIGGSDAEREPVGFVDCYDANTGAWTSVASMKDARSGHGVAVCDGVIYVTGGSGAKGKLLRSAERYDAGANAWKPIANMKKARSGVATVAFDGAIYVFGGENSNGDIVDLVEVYDTGRCYHARVFCQSFLA